MRKLMKYWWIQLLLLFALLAATWICMKNGIILLYWLEIVMLFWVILLFIMAVAAFFQKRYRLFWGILGYGVGMVCCYVLFYFLVMMEVAFGQDKDPFGRKHPIPVGLEYNEPLKSRDSVSVDSCDRATYLQVREGGQPGIYRYDFYASHISGGTVFLKCFEVTGNVPLSVRSVKERTAVDVDACGCFTKICDDVKFTIYEGVWGEPYAVRVEVWLHDGIREHKLMEKIYKMEGWMR